MSSSSGISIPTSTAIPVFKQALTLARSSEPLPAEWSTRAHTVGQFSTTTYTSLLGTALLARACNPHVDPLALKQVDSYRAYSARTLSEQVLVPLCNEAGIDLRNSGSQPLNASMFLRATKVTRDMRAKYQTEHEFVCDCLQAIDFLDTTAALRALAAFLRDREAAPRASKPVPVGDGVFPLSHVEASLAKFMSGQSEGGKVGQAAVAAMLELAFANVRTKAINDPTPIDVEVTVDGG